jgi:phosphoglycerate dehydrogenase-like enzyme
VGTSRVLVSPHTSAHGDGTLARAGDVFLAKLEHYVAGAPLENEVSPRAAAGPS